MLATLASTSLAAPGEPAQIYQALRGPALRDLNAGELQQSVDSIAVFPKVLGPRIWTADYHMRPEISSRVMAIVNRQFKSLRLRNKAIAIQDMESFGSNAPMKMTGRAR